MKSETLGKSQAFASIAVDGVRVYHATGLTKREYLAAMAMQGLLSNEQGYYLEHDKLAEYAVTQADALILELNKEK